MGKDYEFDDAARARARAALELIGEQLERVSQRCRFCGQLCSRLDSRGSCSKTTPEHNRLVAEAWRT